MRAELIEVAAFHVPKGLESYRAFRIEYGGHADACVVEGFIWLPPGVDFERIEEILNGKES